MSWHSPGRCVMAETSYLQGSIIRHVIRDAGISSTGLLAVLAVDVLDLFYLGLLQDGDIIAALGFSWPILLGLLALSLGVSTTMLARVSREIGKGNRERARQLASHIMIMGLVLNSLVSLLIWFTLPSYLMLIGAEGRTAALALSYLQIIVPCLPILTVSMSAGCLLRAAGAPKRAMVAKISGAAGNAVLDPIFIFFLGMGMPGAAVATALSRVMIMAVALHGVWRVYDLLGPVDKRVFVRDLSPVLLNAIPVGISKLATPLASAILIACLARHGPAAVAAMAIIDRIAPFAFVGLSALPQSIGPILGQNLGAGGRSRIRQIWRSGGGLLMIYMLLIFLALALSREHWPLLFGAKGETASLIAFYSLWIVPCYFFNGLQALAHTSFNISGHAFQAMLFDLGRDSLGLVPLILLGGFLAGPHGILMGFGASMILFGSWSFLRGYQLTLRQASG